uniref:Uncharacterized protein n=1 Tax=viral metagenome TaxID=1070528 RepID=A0A6C0JM52_9ZZZZ
MGIHFSKRRINKRNTNSKKPNSFNSNHIVLEELKNMEHTLNEIKKETKYYKSKTNSTQNQHSGYVS